jgi:CelD/BcsL family acetyltransferase involved in cellulose biosynthesis
MHSMRMAAGQIGGAYLPSTADKVAAPVLPADSRLSLVMTLADFEELEGHWLALEAEARPHGVFQSFAWCAAYARSYLGHGKAAKLAVVTGYCRGRLVFVWPLMKVGVGPLRVLRWLSEPFGQYGDVLVANGHCPAIWLRAAWALLEKSGGADIVRLRHVRQDAAAHAFIRETFKDSRVDEGAPYLDLTAFPDAAAYEARYGKEQRRRRKRIRKTLEELGPVDFRLLTRGPEMERQMQAALAEKCKWIGERNLWSKALGCPRLGELLEAAARGRGAAKVVTSVLSAGGKAISWEIGLRLKDTHFAFITAHDTSFTDASPARLHMDLSQRRAIADGMKIFDLMVPLDRHKDSWSNAVMPVGDFHRPLSLLGRLYGALYLERLRPMLRCAYYGSTPRVRSAVARVKRALIR